MKRKIYKRKYNGMKGQHRRTKAGKGAVVGGGVVVTVEGMSRKGENSGRTYRTEGGRAWKWIEVIERKWYGDK